jgi:hypothetical protein
MPGDWFDEGGTGNPVDIPALLDNEAVLEAIGQVLSAGALLSMGGTSDGGALGVTITVDGRWRREYFREAEELQSWFGEALPAVRQACEAASSARRKRPRTARGL